jgi:Major Facilitator Superfamily
MGGERLCARLRRASHAVRSACGPVRAPAHADRRPRHIHPGVALVRPRRVRIGSQCGASPAGRGRGDIELSAALAVLGHAFQGADRAKAFGFWGTVVGIAVAVGPLVGGLITSTLGWRWAFFVNIPVGAALIWLAIDAVVESRDPDAQRLDIAGIVLFGGGLFCLVWALIGANVAGWSGRETLTKLLASAVLLALFVAAELMQDRPMADFALFRKRTFLGASFAMLGFATLRASHDDVSAALFAERL